jgi:hypothetical protein
MNTLQWKSDRPLDPTSSNTRSDAPYGSVLLLQRVRTTRLGTKVYIRRAGIRGLLSRGY